MIAESVELTTDQFRKFKSAKIIKDHQKDIVGLDFSDDGEFIYSADSTTLIVYNTQDGKQFRKLYMKNH
jgi:WD40 repeat protein